MGTREVILIPIGTTTIVLKVWAETREMNIAQLDLQIRKIHHMECMTMTMMALVIVLIKVQIIKVFGNI